MFPASRLRQGVRAGSVTRTRNGVEGVCIILAIYGKTYNMCVSMYGGEGGREGDGGVEMAAGGKRARPSVRHPLDEIPGYSFIIFLTVSFVSLIFYFFFLGGE